VALVSTIFLAARYYRSRATQPVGRISEIDGRVEVRDERDQSWRGIGAGDAILNSSTLKIGPSGMAKISGPMGSFIAGPDTSLKIQTKDNDTTVTLESGELMVRHGTNPGNLYISTSLGQVGLASKTEIVISKPAGHNFSVIEAKSGEAKVLRPGEAAKALTTMTSPLLLADAKVLAIWIKSPEPEMIIPSKEGFAAVAFAWHANKNTGPANILIRNIETGEMVIHESTNHRDDVTLPAGSYSWSLNTGGLISTTRRFHIKGEANPEVAKSEKLDSSTNRQIAAQKPDDTAADTKLKPQSTKPPILEKPTIRLIEPKEGASISVDALTEQRVYWETKGDVDSIDLEILGSSGNPAKQFTLEGDRTRRRLPALPPGRYTVRVRANGSQGDVTASSPWAETFFDVVQTEAGQLAPTDIKVSTTKKGSVSYILVEWSKSAAPRYQVTLTTAESPAKVARTIKSQVMLNIPKDPVTGIEVCALDANLQVRGCAPKVENPEL
jgi:hypothetical protein